MKKAAPLPPSSPARWRAACGAAPDSERPGCRSRAAARESLPPLAERRLPIPCRVPDAAPLIAVASRAADRPLSDRPDGWPGAGPAPAGGCWPARRSSSPMAGTSTTLAILGMYSGSLCSAKMSIQSKPLWRHSRACCRSAKPPLIQQHLIQLTVFAHVQLAHRRTLVGADGFRLRCSRPAMLQADMPLLINPSTFSRSG